ncbi:MAG: hypothetical protein K6A23_15035 [Butyrivibrio sp.]|nr:hypothetical protein [Butyrivibrio sp.]
MKKYLAVALGVMTCTSMVVTGCSSASVEETTDDTAVESSLEASAQAVAEVSTEEAAVAGASKEMEDGESEGTDLAALVEGYDLVYGTVNLPYADFYYGEINSLEPEFDAQAADLEAADAIEAAGFEAEGMYDAVTSATNSKSTRYEQTYFEENGDGANILGVANVNVAISKALYDDAKAQIEAGAECANALLEIVENMTVADEMPAEFKVIGSDGTLSATVGNTTVPSEAEASFTSISAWGNYQISVEGIELDAATIQGGLLVTSDGTVYGLEHNDNLWLSAGEIAFAVEEFTEPHGNTPSYQRFADIQGKTITKVIYMIANGDDIEIDTDFFVNLQLDDEYGITGDEEVTYSAEGTAVNYELNVPEDTDYVLSAISFGRSKMDISTVEAADGVITLPADFKPGSYSFSFEDEQYAGLKFTTLVESGLKDGDVTFNGETFEINSEDFTAADYITNLSSVSINGEPVKGKGLSAILFDENGNLNLDAEMTSGDETVALFPEGDSYEVTIEATAYPSVSFTVER